MQYCANYACTQRSSLRAGICRAAQDYPFDALLHGQKLAPNLPCGKGGGNGALLRYGRAQSRSFGAILRAMSCARLALYCAVKKLHERRKLFFERDVPGRGGGLVKKNFLQCENQRFFKKVPELLHFV